MNTGSPIPMVRCRLRSEKDNTDKELRYIPAAEFELWRHFMETRHDRRVDVETVSHWVPETPDVWDESIDADTLHPVLRVEFEKPGPQGTTVPVVRFFPTEDYPQARAALLAHFDVRCRWTVQSTPGYFVNDEQTDDADDFAAA